MGEVRYRIAQVGTWADGFVVRVTSYLGTDIDEARAAAERLARERGVPHELRTPDLVEVGRRAIEELNRRDFDVGFANFAPDAVWELSPGGFGLLQTPLTGLKAIRTFWELDLTTAFDDFEVVNEEYQDVGNGVTFSVSVLRGRPHGASSFVAHRVGVVWSWTDGRISRAKNYIDIQEARIAAARLAEERG